MTLRHFPDHLLVKLRLPLGSLVVVDCPPEHIWPSADVLRFGIVRYARTGPGQQWFRVLDAGDSRIERDTDAIQALESMPLHTDATDGSQWGISVWDHSGEQPAWKDMHSGGKPYRFDSLWQAENVMEMSYPDCIRDRDVRIVKVDASGRQTPVRAGDMKTFTEEKQMVTEASLPDTMINAERRARP